MLAGRRRDLLREKRS